MKTEPNAFAWPARTLPTASTPGVFAAASATLTGIGEKLFWAVTAYNVTDGSMVAAPQLMPSINGMNEVATNADGSTDLWFGPERPADALESNWIQTVPDRNFLVTIRLYGTGVEFFDQTWKPDDVVKVQ